jgi:hypothetical protein
MLHPGVERRLGHTDLLGQLADRPFVGPALERRLAATVSRLDDAGANQQMMHHRRVERGTTLRRAPAFPVERLGDGSEAVAGAPELPGASDQLGVSAQGL